MNYIYTIKHLEFEGKRDCLYFSFEEETGILTNFFSGEMTNFHKTIMEQIELVLFKKKKNVECSGNDCYWDIGPKETLIVDNFANKEESSEITLDTRALKRLIKEWIEAKAKFKEQKAKG